MKILVVDDDPLTRSVVKSNLEDPLLRGASNNRREVRLASSVAEAEAFLDQESFDFAFIDIQLGRNHKTGGIQVLERLRKRSTTTVPIIMTSVEDLNIVQTCLNGGAAEILFKPFNFETLNLVMIKAREVQRLLRHNLSLRSQLKPSDNRSSMVTQSPKFQEVLSLAKRAEGTDLSVLILGETGAGKEAMARYLWSLENDPSRPFVAVHTGTLNENLVQSELFGHERGAFTGANETRIGKFEAANGGDLFLDEIATMSPDVQTKFLRVLQDKTVTRIGSNRPINLDCRIICATNADLEEMVAKGKFREDLYFRIKGLTFNIPPLRDRKEDLPALVTFFLKKAAPLESKFLSKEAAEFCLQYGWPGNIRELENALLTLAKITKGTEISVSDLRNQIRPFKLNKGSSQSPEVPEGSFVYALKESEIDRNFDQLVSVFEQTVARIAMKQQGSIKGASNRLGIPRTTLASKIKSWGWKDLT